MKLDFIEYSRKINMKIFTYGICSANQKDD